MKGEDVAYINRCIKELNRISKYTNISLRTLEQIYGHIIRVLAFVPRGTFRNEAVVTGLALLKVTAPHLFYKAKLGSLDYSEVTNIFGLIGSANATPEINEMQRMRDQKWFEYCW